MGAEIRAYIDGLLRYFEFSGRSSRSQFWLFHMAALLLAVVAVYVDYRLTGQLPEHFRYGPLLNFCLIFHFMPSLALTVRRLHDIGRSGWWWLISFVPLVGGIVLLYWDCRPSEPWPNRYGDPPDAATSGRRSREGEVNPIIERALRARSSRPPSIGAADPGSTSTRRFI